MQNRGQILHKAAVVSHASFPGLSLGRNERRAKKKKKTFVFLGR